jgi:hypothetical protein
LEAGEYNQSEWEELEASLGEKASIKVDQVKVE